MLQEALIEIVPLESTKMEITPRLRLTHLRSSHSLHQRPSSGSAYTGTYSVSESPQHMPGTRTGEQMALRSGLSRTVWSSIQDRALAHL